MVYCTLSQHANFNTKKQTNKSRTKVQTRTKGQTKGDSCAKDVLITKYNIYEGSRFKDQFNCSSMLFYFVSWLFLLRLFFHLIFHFHLILLPQQYYHYQYYQQQCFCCCYHHYHYFILLLILLHQFNFSEVFFYFF